MVEYDTGDEPFVNESLVVIVLLGIDGTMPPDDMLRTMQDELEFQVNQALEFDINRASVHLTTSNTVSDYHRDELGSYVGYLLQFDVDIGDEEVTQKKVNGVHNHVVDHINSLGFNVTGTKTTVINKEWK